MALRTEVINLIIPIERINECYPGGFEAYISQNEEPLGRTTWYDDYLFRDGAMCGEDIDWLIDYWVSMGLKFTEQRDGKEWFIDMCVFDIVCPVNDCDWIDYDRKDRTVFYRGKPKGRVIGREEMRSMMDILPNNVFMMEFPDRLVAGDFLVCKDCGKRRYVTEEWIEYMCKKFFLHRSYGDEPHYRMFRSDIARFKCVKCGSRKVDVVSYEDDEAD